MEEIEEQFTFQLIKRNNLFAPTSGIKHWGLDGWIAFAPVSCFFLWDTDAPRKPQRFIPANVGANKEKRLCGYFSDII